MKIYDILIENDDIDEAPMGFSSKIGNKILSKIPGAGSSAKARLAVGNDANTMKKDLVAWMSGSGIKKGTLLIDDFKDFLGQKGLPTDQVDAMLARQRQATGGEDVGGPMSTSDVDAILKSVVQQGFKRQGAKGNPSNFARAKSPAMPSMRRSANADLQSAIKKLKAAGYNVSK